MFKRRRFLPVLTLLLLTGVSFGCSPSRATTVPSPTGASATASTVPTILAATATQAAPATTAAVAPTAALTPTLTSPAPQPNPTLNATTACRLIDSSDLAHLFPPHNEIVRNPPTTTQVSHPPFSTSPASGKEFTCLFFDFHQPGVAAGWMLQVTLRVDLPESGMEAAWSQAWDAAKSASGQPVSGLGDGAFAVGSVLYLKKGSTYLSFESVDTHLDEKTPAGVQALLAYEKQLAAAALGRIK